MMIKTTFKKGFFILLVIFIFNFILKTVAIPYLAPISIENISLSSFTSLEFFITLIVYVFIIGIAVEQIDRKVK